LICAILSYVFESEYTSKMWYIVEPQSPGINFVLRYFGYFILLNTMIPISLIVSLEIVKLIQAYFISRDDEMYVAARDRYPVVMTSTINEELG